jgi:N-acetyl-alpha-D-glucosaminyl L-malate synthase BshA
MRIAIICYPTHGGSGVIATELGIELAKRGHQIHFISYSTPFRLHGFQQNVYYHEVDISDYPLFKYPPYDLSLATKIVQVVGEYDIDIIHAHYAIPHAISAYLAKQMLNGKKPKIITTLHGTDITLVGMDSSFYQAVKFSLDESDGVTAVSNYLAERTAREFAVQKQIRIIYNFVDTKRFDGQVADCNIRSFVPNKEKILIHASNFRPVKRLNDVIKIFAHVRKEIPVRLIMVGEGPDRQTSHALSIELGVNNEVLYLGTQDYMENLLGCADVFLLPSSEESFGLAALEALSCRTPVIGTRVGGVPEVISHGENGYLHQVGDVEAMGHDIVRLFKDKDKMRRFQEAARQTAVDRFDTQLIVPQYEQFYLEILNG